MKRKEYEITDIVEIESIISSADVCRIAMSDGINPYIVTLNFGYTGSSGRCFYFHCATEGKKLEMIRKNNHVCFELDTSHEVYEGEMACDFGMGYRSVVGWGNIVIINDNDDKKKGLDVIMHHYSDRPGFEYREKSLDRMLVLRLDITEMTGKGNIPGREHF